VLDSGITMAGEFAPEINLAHLERRGFGRIRSATLGEVKEAIAARGFASRPLEVVL
jgi:hypothetical protein